MPLPTDFIVRTEEERGPYLAYLDRASALHHIPSRVFSAFNRLTLGQHARPPPSSWQPFIEWRPWDPVDPYGSLYRNLPMRGSGPVRRLRGEVHRATIIPLELP